MTTLIYTPKSDFKPTAHLLIGEARNLTEARLSAVLPKAFSESSSTAPLKLLAANKLETFTTYAQANDEPVTQVTVASVKTAASRHMGFIRSDLIAEIIRKQTPKEQDGQSADSRMNVS